MTSPQQLPPISDGEDALGKIEGVISTDDEDAYQRRITDDQGGFLDPYASTASPNVQLCMFLECDNNDADVIEITNCNGAAPLDYSDTKKGCCGPVIDIDYECSGLDDHVQAFIRIRSTAPQCEAYTITTKQ